MMVRNAILASVVGVSLVAFAAEQTPKSTFEGFCAHPQGKMMLDQLPGDVRNDFEAACNELDEVLHRESELQKAAAAVVDAVWERHPDGAEVWRRLFNAKEIKGCCQLVFFPNEEVVLDDAASLVEEQE